MVSKKLQLSLIFVLLCHWARLSSGHGRLWTPPGRSSMWRQGFDTPVNYQDNELFCGGYAYLISKGYKCGLCGDPYDKPRENEAGGKYATGTIGRSYRQGQRTTIQVDITANHGGYFEFNICPTNNPSVPETQACFDKYPVHLAEGSGTRYPIPTGTKMMDVEVVLPKDLTCSYCVLQWRYHAGNSWGTGQNRQACVGCGPQEEFYGCADIEIVPPGSPIQNRAPNSTSSTSDHDSTEPAEEFHTDSTHHDSDEPLVDDAKVMVTVCRGVRGQTRLDNWCDMNCKLGYCPESLCECEDRYVTPQPGSGCRASQTFAKIPGYDKWCADNCAFGNCPDQICVCYK